MSTTTPTISGIPAPPDIWNATNAVTAPMTTATTMLPALRLKWLPCKRRSRILACARCALMSREAFFFARGWSGPYAVDNVTFRDPPGSSGRLRILMRGRTAYQCLLRLDAASRDQGAPTIELRVNGSACPTSNPDVSDGVPRYWATIPAGVVREGLNHVDIVSLSPTVVRRADSAGVTAPDAGFRLWYLRLFPKQSR